jgi:hypothetical protein
MNIDDLRNFKPNGFLGSSNTEGIRRPFFDVGEHLPKAQRGFQEIARISLSSSTGDVISIRAKINKKSIRISVIDEYDTKFLDYKSSYKSIPTQGEIFDVIRDMNNEPNSQYYWVEIVEMLELKSLKEIANYMVIDSLVYPNLNDLLMDFFMYYGYN